ncbi:MAG: restriction endonuclease subunit S [FCB group bacterium]|jgi:type I restriction enzyme S subunit|nr:restriction endonuclease subunit S [FCB group bacterium]
MSVVWAQERLDNLLSPINRAEPVDSSRIYRLLGARWYAQGLFVKDEKFGHNIKANTLYRVKAGDFVYNRLFAWKGSFAIAADDANDCHVSNEFPCFAVNRERLDPSYLKWWFSQESEWLRALGLSSGATPTSRNRLKEAHFLGMEIPLPPLDEQRRIVARIDELAAKVEEAKGLRQQSDQATLAFVAATHTTLASSPPEPLCNFLELHEDAVPIEIGIPYPQVGVRGFGGGLFAKPPVLGGQTTYRTFNRLYSSALVMSQVKGWEGAIAVTPPGLEGYFVSPEYRTFRCKEGRCLPEYLAAIVPTEFFWGRLKDATRGVGARRERTRPEQFLQLSFSMPSLSDQQRAVAMFAMMPEIRRIQRETDAEMNAMLPAILDKAFRGEM